MATDLALYKCHECHMTFNSPGLLTKHKSKFCPGTSVTADRWRIPLSPRPDTPEGDPPRRNPDPQLAQLAASHGRQMEALQGRNRDLERQRDEIRRRLEQLGRRPVKDDDNSNELLQELRDLEARNQKLLAELRRQLADARQPINIIAEEHLQQKQSFTYPLYYGNSLVAEIIAVRQAYLQNGGSDPEVLAHLAQMQAEAQALEDQLRNQKPPPPKKKEKSTDYMQTVMALEMENERMQRELMLLQEQNMLARTRRKDDREDDLEALIRRLQQEHLRKMYELQREIERLRNEAYLWLNTRHEVVENPTKVIIAQAPAPQPCPPPQIIQAPAPAPVQIAAPPPPPQQRYVEVESVVPYDQYFSMGPRVTSVQPFQTVSQFGSMPVGGMPMGGMPMGGMPMTGGVPFEQPIMRGGAMMPQQSWMSSQSRRVVENEVG